MTTSARTVAALPMYDFAETREALQGLWSAIASHMDPAAATELPAELSWGGDPEQTWVDPSLVLGQTCGWPLASFLHGRVTVVGAFHHALGDQPDGPAYRSVIVAMEDRPLASFAGTVGAINQWTSLSGCVSLGAAVSEVSEREPFFADVIETGAHVVSLAAVNSGDAAIAAIDAVTFALMSRARPDLVRDLVVVGRGPVVPTLPLITAADDPAPLQRAIASALADPTTSAWRDQLFISGFSPMTHEDYGGLSGLARRAERALGRAVRP